MSSDKISDEQMSAFEQKLRDHETEIREGKNNSASSPFPERKKREVSEEEKTPQVRFHPVAVPAVALILAALVLSTAFTLF